MNACQPQPDACFRRELRSQVAEFDELAKSLTDWGTAQGVPARALQGVVLILDELFANVVMHGYRGDPSGEVTVEAYLQGSDVVVTLTDRAPHFNPLDVAEPDTDLDIDDREIGGLGLLFVRRTADTLSYAAEDTQGRPANVLTFTKRAT